MLDPNPEPVQNANVGMYTYATKQGQSYKVREFQPTDYALVTTMTSSVHAPNKFKNGWNHKNNQERSLWRNVILKELQDMNK